MAVIGSMPMIELPKAMSSNTEIKSPSLELMNTLVLKMKHKIVDLTLSSPSPLKLIVEDRIILTSPRKPKKESLHTRPPKRPATPILVIDSSDSDEPKITKITKFEPKPKLKPNRPIPETFSLPQVGSVYGSLQDAEDEVFERERRLGHTWKKAQMKRDPDSGSIKKQTLRCNHYDIHKPTHSISIDPSDHRKGKTIKTGCLAHVNVNLSNGLWRITLVQWDHNHAPQIPPGGTAPRPPTKAQRDVVAQFSAQNFSRQHLGPILNERFPNHRLEPRQITNMLNSARKDARNEVTSLGGDVSAILSHLQAKSQEEHGWKYHLKLDDDQVLIGLWWQSPKQARLTKRYYDVLITDNSYNRNQYGYPLDIGIIIDDAGKSRNAWYAFHRSESTAMHVWVFQCHLDSAGTPPDVIASDRHASLISAVELTMPLTLHIFCLHHLTGNVAQQLRLTLGSSWSDFNHNFWTTYRAVSPEEFDHLWNILIQQYPKAQRYLEEELYPCRDKWAWAWITTKFSAGVRTNGRAEVENRTNKAIGHPKKTLLEVFNGLNQRTDDQNTLDLINVRDVSLLFHFCDLTKH